MPDTVHLSVIVPAHNAGVHLASCISALESSDLDRRKWELIIVDDASTDATGSIASRGDLVVSTGTVARGPAFARNIGAAASRGALLAFVDADVSVHTDALSKLVTHLEDDTSLVAAFGSYDAAPVAESVVSRYRNLLHRYAHQKSSGRVTTFWAGCGVVRAGAFRDVGGFDAARYPTPQIEDIELGYRLRQKGEILLDPSIQGTHHKRWTIGSIVRTDLRDRALPWVKLLLSRNPLPSGKTPSLGPMAAMVTALSCIGLMLLILGVFVWSPILLVAAALSLGLSIALNFELYRWLLEHGGAGVAVAAIPLQIIYQVISAVAVPVGAIQFLLAPHGGPTAGKGEAPLRPPAARFVPLAVGEVGARVIAFAATAYLARTLGASGFGRIAFAIALVSHFGIALAAGVGEVGARDVARDPDNANSIASVGIALRLAFAAFALIAIFIVASVLHIDEQTRRVTLLYSLSVIPFALDSNWIYKGLGQTANVAIALVLAQVLSLVMIILLVTSGDQVARVPLIQVAADLAAAAFLFIPLMRGRWHTPSASAVMAFAGRVKTVTVSRILRTIVVSFDIVLLGLLVSEQEVGWYSAAYRIVFFAMALTYASQTAFVGEAARALVQPDALSRVLSRAVGLGLLVSIPFAVGGGLVAQPLIAEVFGAEYVNGAASLRILLLSLVLLSIHGATRHVFLALQRMELELALIAIGAVVNVVANLTLIPVYGIRGAAIATVAGEGVIVLGVFIALGRLGIRVFLNDSAAAIVGGVAMGGALLALGLDRPVVQSVVAGGFVYFGAVAVFTLLSRRRDSTPLLR